MLWRDPNDRRDLRTFSVQATGDSKLLESQVPRIVRWLVEAARIPPGLSAEEALAALGLEWYARPVLLAGPVRFGGCDARGLTYVDIVPEQIDAVVVTDPAASILIIENSTSFNRHVREIGAASEIVVYTGGFPSRSVVRLVRRLGNFFGGRVSHWGDVDPGGVRIADHSARSAAPELRLHLMDLDLALRNGRPMQADTNVWD